MRDYPNNPAPMRQQINPSMSAYEWSAHVKRTLAAAGVCVVRLASGAYRIRHGIADVTVADLRFLDKRDLRDLMVGGAAK